MIVMVDYKYLFHFHAKKGEVLLAELSKICCMLITIKHLIVIYFLMYISYTYKLNLMVLL